MCTSSQPKGEGRESRVPAARALELSLELMRERKEMCRGGGGRAGTRGLGQQHRLSHTRYTNTYQYTLNTGTHVFIVKEMGLGGRHHFKN